MTMRFDEGQMDWLADLLADAARQEIMPRFRRLDVGDIRQKTSPADLVTEADVNAERFITAKLKERFADAVIVGEEACSDNPALLTGLDDAELPSPSIRSMALSILHPAFRSLVSCLRSCRKVKPLPVSFTTPSAMTGSWLQKAAEATSVTPMEI